LKKKFNSIHDLDPKTLRIDLIQRLPNDIKAFPAKSKDGTQMKEAEE
jgi:hypothetical protein